VVIAKAAAGHAAVPGYRKNRPRDMKSTIQLWRPFGANAADA